MTAPTRSASYREIPSIITRAEVPVGTKRPSEEDIIAEHVSHGWTQEPGNEDELIFSCKLADGRKWTRHYDRKDCHYMCQRFYEIEAAVKVADWPPVHFGD